MHIAPVIASGARIENPQRKLQMDTAVRRRGSTWRKKSPPREVTHPLPPVCSRRVAPCSLYAPCKLRLSLIRVFSGRMALPISREHIIILGVKARVTQPIITLLQFIYLKLILRSHITLLALPCMTA